MVSLEFVDFKEMPAPFDTVIKVDPEASAPQVFEACYRAYIAAGYQPANWEQACKDYVEAGEDSFLI